MMFFALIGTQLGWYYRSNKDTVDVVIRRVVELARRDKSMSPRTHRDEKTGHEVIDILVYYLPDKKISWDPFGFWVEGDKKQWSFIDARARCFVARYPSGTIEREKAWDDVKGSWV